MKDLIKRLEEGSSQRGRDIDIIQNADINIQSYMDLVSGLHEFDVDANVSKSIENGDAIADAIEDFINARGKLLSAVINSLGLKPTPGNRKRLKNYKA